MNILQAALLGLVQGLGEFLPISSSGHLLLGRIFMGLNDQTAAYKMLDIFLHVGTLIPVLIVFRKDWLAILKNPFKSKTLLMLFVGVVVLISCCQAFKWPGGIQPGGVVLCIVMFQKDPSIYLEYSVMRMIDTGVGVACALFVNWYFTRPRVEHILTKLHIPHNEDGSVFIFKRDQDKSKDETKTA